MVGVGHPHCLGIQILVGHAPGVGELDVLLRHAALVDDAVAVAAEEGVHVVEVAAPAVDEHAVVALRAELLAETGEAALAADALDDGASRGRRYRQGDGFQTAVSAGTGGIEVVEEQAVLAQLVEVGGQAAAVAEAAEVLGRQALDGHQYHVELGRRAGVVDLPADIQRLPVIETSIGFLQFLAQERGDFRLVQRRVELLVVQLVVAEGGEELVRAVAGQFVLVGVAAEAARMLLVERGEAKATAGGKQGETDQALAQQRQFAVQGAAHQRAQGERQADGQRGDGAEQTEHRVGLEDVVDHFLRVDQVVDGDEVETHAELVPEQPFGQGAEQHGEQADGQQAV
ncbi:hypothetical protein D3C80_1043190 [compost metagenome]